MENQKGRQTRKRETVAFRVPEDRKHMMRAAAARRDEFLSDWLRRAADAQLRREIRELD